MSDMIVLKPKQLCRLFVLTSDATQMSISFAKLEGKKMFYDVSALWLKSGYK